MVPRMGPFRRRDCIPHQPTGTLSGREASVPTYLHLQQPPQPPWFLSFLATPTSPVGSDSHMYLIFRNKVNTPVAVTK